MFIPHPGLGALFTLLVCLFPSFVLADIVNRTIDDGNGDSATGVHVTYFPAQPNPPWANQNCAVCAIKPDINQAFMNTYTAATWFPQDGTMSITMQFTGTAIYVFFILVNSLGGGVSTLTLANFTLDGNAPTSFQHAADPQRTDILYNQLVYHQTNLVNTEHTLVISASQVPTSIYVNFDYAIYTHDDDVLPSSGNSPAPAPNSISPSATPGSSNSYVTTTTSIAMKSGSSAGNSNSLSTIPSTTTSVSPGSVSPKSGSPNSGSSNSGSSNSSSSNSGTQVDSTAGSKNSTHAGAIAGAVVGIAVLALLIAAGVIWFRRRRQAKSLQVVSQFPVMAELPDESQATSSPILSNTQSTPSRSGKHEEIERARELASRRHPVFVPQDVDSRGSGTSQDMRDRSLSPIATQNRHSGSVIRSATGSKTGDASSEGVTTSEIAQQLRQIQDQISSLRDQRQSPSTEGLLENPPPGYQPDPPS